jgi:hypothetical protein
MEKITAVKSEYRLQQWMVKIEEYRIAEQV